MYLEPTVIGESVILKKKKIIEQDVRHLFNRYIKNIIIDTSPDIRQQLIKNNIKNIDCALFSHKHGDQIHGINDLRVFSLKSNQKIPIYADLETGNYLKNNFFILF